MRANPNPRTMDLRMNQMPTSKLDQLALEEVNLLCHLRAEHSDPMRVAAEYYTQLAKDVQTYLKEIGDERAQS